MHNMSRGDMAAMAKVDTITTTSCGHTVCEHQPQALANENNAGSVQVLSLQHRLILATLTFPSLEHSLLRVSETPPLRPDLLAFLQTTLRV